MSTSDPEVQEFKKKLEFKYHEKNKVVPVIAANGRFLTGKKEVSAKLDWFVSELIASGGCPFPKVN